MNCLHQLLPIHSISPSLQNKLVEKIYSNPDDPFCFNKINQVCFNWSLRVDFTMCTCMTKYISILSYDKSTKRCKILFSEQLKKSLDPKDYFWAYIHQLIHAYLYMRLPDREIDQASDHQFNFKYHLDRIHCLFYDVCVSEHKGIECLVGKSSDKTYYHCAICPIDDISSGLPKPNKPVTDTNIVEPVRNDLSATNNARVSTRATNKTKTPVLKRNTNTTSTSVTKSLVTINKNNTARKYSNPANVPNKTTTTNVQSKNKNITTSKSLQGNTNTTSTSVTKSLVTINKNNTVRKSSNFANVPIKTTTTNVQSTNKNIVTRKPLQGNANTTSTSVTKSLVTANKNNTVKKSSHFANVPIKTTTTNVQSTNKNIVTRKPLQGNANTASTSVTKSSVPDNKNNSINPSSNSGIFPITTTLTNVQGNKIASITATKQSTVIVIHHE